MAPVNMDQLRAAGSDNVLKALKGAVLLGDYPAAEPVTTLESPGGQILVPTAYESVGYISEDGLSFGQDTETSDVRPWGSATFVRRDIQSVERTVQFTALETKRKTAELITGLDLSASEMSETGEISYDIPDRPETRYYRMLTIAQDGSGSSLVYIARFYPRVVVSEVGDETWSDGDDPISYEITMTALLDSEVGYAAKYLQFGPGSLQRAEGQGWEVEDGG